MKLQLTNEEFEEFNDIAKAMGYTNAQLSNLQATAKVIEKRRQNFWKALAAKYGFDPQTPLILNDRDKTLTDERGNQDKTN